MNNALKDWTIAYVKHKDSAFRKLVKTEEKKDRIEFHFRDKINTHFIIDTLTDALFSLIKDCEHKTIVCPNIQENLHFLLKEWKRINAIKNLLFIFVNLKNNDKWVINPHVHAMIADPASLEIGLQTMFDTANGKIAEIKVPKRKPQLFDEDVAASEEEE
ncbi:MAG: hypothetical protein WC916_01250 [Candidatus Woesearchaeota archaeon]